MQFSIMKQLLKCPALLPLLYYNNTAGLVCSNYRGTAEATRLLSANLVVNVTKHCRVLKIPNVRPHILWKIIKN